MKEAESFSDSLYKGPTVTVAATSIDEMAEAISTLRKARGWTQKRLAQELETKQENVCRWERNDWQRITIWRFADVAEALGLSLELRLTLPTQSSHRHSYKDPAIEFDAAMEQWRESRAAQRREAEEASR